MLENHNIVWSCSRIFGKKKDEVGETRKTAVKNEGKLEKLSDEHIGKEKWKQNHGPNIIGAMHTKERSAARIEFNIYTNYWKN